MYFRTAGMELVMKLLFNESLVSALRLPSSGARLPDMLLKNVTSHRSSLSPPSLWMAPWCTQSSTSNTRLFTTPGRDRARHLVVIHDKILEAAKLGQCGGQCPRQLVLVQFQRGERRQCPVRQSA